MNKFKRLNLNVSHAPFLNYGNNISTRTYNIIFSIFPALIFGLINYGISALGVVSFSISSAILWESLFLYISKKDLTTMTNGNAILVGLLIGIMLPASSPWWLVFIGTFIAIVIGIHIYGGIGCNPFNPIALSIAILMVSWKDLFDFNEALINFNLNFTIIADPLITLKHFGTSNIESFSFLDLLLGKHVGSIASSYSLMLILGGIYLIIKGVIRWEIPTAFIIGIVITALFFNILDPLKYGKPLFHLFTGYTMIGIFFLATESSSSPVNFIPMIIYGILAGVMTVLIRNIGLYSDGVIFAILIANLANPIIDKIRPKVIGKVV